MIWFAGPNSGKSAAATYAFGPPSAAWAGTGVKTTSPSALSSGLEEDPKENPAGKAQL